MRQPAFERGLDTPLLAVQREAPVPAVQDVRGLFPVPLRTLIEVQQQAKGVWGHALSCLGFGPDGFGASIMATHGP